MDLDQIINALCAIKEILENLLEDCRIAAYNQDNPTNPKKLRE